MTPASPGPTPSTGPTAAGSGGAAQASDGAPPAELALGCIGVGDAECRFLADLLVERLAGDRGVPFSVMIQLYCGHEPPCPETLDARQGQATLEWTDGDEPVMVSLAGPALEPVIADIDMPWSGLIAASSAPAPGPGPFEFEIGHCGLTWQVDFDQSFWVPVGHVDGEAPGLINQERGVMRKLGPNLAEYTGDEWTVRLARFPGPKHVWLCR